MVLLRMGESRTLIRNGQRIHCYMRCLVLIAYLHASGTRRGPNTRRYHSEMLVRAPLVGEKLSGALFPLGFCRERGSIVFLSIQVHGS